MFKLVNWAAHLQADCGTIIFHEQSSDTVVKDHNADPCS